MRRLSADFVTTQTPDLDPAQWALRSPTQRNTRSMASLFHIRTKRRADLGARCVLGRASTCGLTLSDPRVSGEHAVIWWDEGWWIRDLASRNGTFLDGQRLDNSPHRIARDSRIGLGGSDDGWTLADETAPGPSATGPQGQHISGSFDLLMLPGDDAPLAAIFMDAKQRWVVEQDGKLRAVVNGESIQLQGEEWILALPEALPQTRESSALMLNDITLAFEVSLDEEHVAVSLQAPGKELPLGSRSHHFALLALSRAWLDDPDSPSGERGWVYQDELAKQLGIEMSLLHIHIHRARRQLMDAEILNAAAIVQRRPASGQIRIGTPGVVVSSA